MATSSMATSSMATSSMATSAILCDETLRYLQAKHLITPPARGRRVLSRAVLPSPSRRAPSGPFAAATLGMDFPTFEIPETLDSTTCLELLGFGPDVAETIFHTFTHQPANARQSLIRCALQYVHNANVLDCRAACDPWDDSMRQLGILPLLRHFMLLPEYADIRCTNSLKFWVQETIQDRWTAFAGLDGIICQEKQRRGEEAPAVKPPAAKRRRTDDSDSGSSRMPPPPVPLSMPPPPVPSSMPPPPVPKLLDPLPERFHEGADGAQGALKTAADFRHDHLLLYRASLAYPYHRFFNPITDMADCNAVKSWPGDFAGDTGVVYLTTQRETADRYACWRKQRAPLAAFGITEVAVPQQWSLEVCTTKILPYGDEWRELVWWGQSRQAVPPQITQRYQKFDLIIGGIFTRVNETHVRKIDWREITEQDMMKVVINGVEVYAVQWGVMSEFGARALEMGSEGKVWEHPLGSLVAPVSSRSI